MKVGILYLFAFVVAIAASVVFASNQGLLIAFAQFSGVAINVSVVVSLIFSGITIMGAVAALRRTDQFGKTIPKMILWCVLSGVIFAALSFGGAFIFNPQVSDGLKAYMAELSPERIQAFEVLKQSCDLWALGSTASVNQLVGFNSFVVLLVVVILGYIIGAYLKPDIEVVRPAYVVMNSFNEVGFRFAETWSKITVFLMFFFSASWFSILMQDKIENNPIILSEISMFIPILAVAVVGIVVMTLLAALMARGKDAGAISTLVKTLGVSFVAFASGTPLACYAPLSVVMRRNADVPKKNLSSELPFFMLFARSATAAIGFIVAMAAVNSVSGGLDATSMILSAGLAIALSFICGMKGGHEVAFIAVNVLVWNRISEPEAYLIVFLMAPLATCISAFTDTIISSLGVVANQTDTAGVFAN